MSLHVYDSYSEVFGTYLPYEQFVNLLSTFARDSILWHCAVLNYGVRIWESNTSTTHASVDQELGAALRVYFPPQVAIILVKRLLSVKSRTPFHRRQILLLQKLAFQHCGGAGRSVDENPHVFGALLLIANDHLHSPRAAARPSVLTSPHQFAELMSDLLPTSEIGDEQVGASLTRSSAMLGPILRSHQNDPNYVNVVETFEAMTGIKLQLMRAVLFASVAYLNSLRFRKVFDGRGEVCLNDQRFSLTALSRNEISKILQYLSATPSDLKRAIQERDYGVNDFTELRRSPLVERWWNVGRTDQWTGYLVNDPVYLLEKSLNAPYWTLSEHYHQRFRIFWGTLFEAYCNKLMEQACLDSGSRYIPNPRKANGEELCDGLVLEADQIIVLEYKVCMMSAKAKYSGDSDLLQTHIERNLVEGKDRKKGVKQLADTLRYLFGTERGIEKFTTEWRTIRRALPCIVTMDSIGGSVGLSTMLQLYMPEFDFVDVQVMPLFCSWIGELERRARHFRRFGLGGILNRWHEINPSLGTPLGQIEIDLGEGHDLPLMIEAKELLREDVLTLFQVRPNG